jgi:hypothetical protein
MKTKTAAWVEWFDGQHIDARLVILLCLAMIEKAEKAIAKEKR